MGHTAEKVAGSRKTYSVTPERQASESRKREVEALIARLTELAGERTRFRMPVKRA